MVMLRLGARLKKEVFLKEPSKGFRSVVVSVVELISNVLINNLGYVCMYLNMNQQQQKFGFVFYLNIFLLLADDTVNNVQHLFDMYYVYAYLFKLRCSDSIC